VLQDHEPAPWPIHLVHVEGRRAPAKVRSFVDFARDRLRARLADMLE
ncbi:MAG: LysR family transcriptional regulator, partial [Pseudomonadota bacterium]|nr:LysR family transcriptional regulator [Pseudomonadota bacterium]